MRAREVLGRTIVKVHQQRCYESGRQVQMHVTFELDNGDRLIPVVGELEGDYTVDFVVNKSGRHRRGRR